MDTQDDYDYQFKNEMLREVTIDGWFMWLRENHLDANFDSYRSAVEDWNIAHEDHLKGIFNLE